MYASYLWFRSHDGYANLFLADCRGCRSKLATERFCREGRCLMMKRKGTERYNQHVIAKERMVANNQQ